MSIAPENYNPSQYVPFAVTADLNIFTIRDGALSILLVKRGDNPYKDHWALPGGFCQPDESVEQAAYRELAEETGLTVLDDDTIDSIWVNAQVPPALDIDEAAAAGLRAKGHEVIVNPDNKGECLARSYGQLIVRSDEDWKFHHPNSVPSFHIEQVRTYSTPDRDPRMRVVSVSFAALAANLPDPVAGDDAAEARWWRIDEVLETDEDGNSTFGLAFDHFQIITDALERVRSKLEYTTLATSFLKEPFSIAELRAVYAAVWGEAPDLANLRRKVLSVEGFVEEVGKSAGGSAGPAPMLYKAGPTKTFTPALTRK